MKKLLIVGLLGAIGTLDTRASAQTSGDVDAGGSASADPSSDVNTQPDTAVSSSPPTNGTEATDESSVTPVPTWTDERTSYDVESALTDERTSSDVASGAGDEQTSNDASTSSSSNVANSSGADAGVDHAGAPDAGASSSDTAGLDGGGGDGGLRVDGGETSSAPVQTTAPLPPPKTRTYETIGNEKRACSVSDVGRGQSAPAAGWILGLLAVVGLVRRGIVSKD